MRIGGTWHDVSVRNVSSRGMLLQSPAAPARGTYLEIYRGRHIIVARAAWQSGASFGVQTQDRVDVEGLIQEPDVSGANFTAAIKENKAFERRRAERTVVQRAERSRSVAAMMEFLSLVAFGVSTAIAAFALVGSSLAAPLERVKTALEPTS